MACQSVLKRCGLQHDIASACIACPDSVFHGEKLTWYTAAEGQRVDAVILNIRVISHIQACVCIGPSINPRPEITFRMSCPNINSERSWCCAGHNSESKAIT